MNHIPPLPALDADTQLEIYTHRSIRYTPDGQESVDRLAELGSSVLSMAVVHTLFSKQPKLPAEELKVRRPEKHNEILITKVPEWVSLYGMKSKVRGVADRSILDRPEEYNFLFNSYVGAVYDQKGFPSIIQWIGRLVDPEAPTIPLPGDGASPPPYTSNSSLHSSPAATTSTTLSSATLDSPPPQNVPPSMTVLATFNQTCAQRGMTINWDATADGPSHQPRWVVRCLVNGVLRGTGVGRNQKVAKEEAAKQAYQSLWGH
ncbi:hypothetical protein F5J12DRAFT_971023 [Pisolithus orientalis]|uniref:uncharacterized protein n=1 Tax=Pisolithus orientalis TaxID=936130 RepID=UPI0022244CAC|nr:uncharacterized protein F5J12DRAFT_971023 [Pisolithus orientalis]KAI6012443.1 hypothetical protein F5J12DRAFT_971023 [Pisolithus orientalis]